MTQIDSPCILVCSIDSETGCCHGCGRTSSEIARWIDYSSDERHTIMQKLPERMTKLERKPRRVTKRKRLKQATKASRRP